MKTIITFKALRGREIVYKNIPIYHNFKEIPPHEFDGLKPAISVEDQVIRHLDEIDKRDMMIEHDFDIIIDYYNRYNVTSGHLWTYCVPFNEETRHLHGTAEDAPEFYRVCEDF